MEFKCSVKNESWVVEVEFISFEDYQYELIVLGRGQKFHVLIGIHAYGNFLCIPSMGIDYELASFGDKFWNRERISNHLSLYDTETLVCAINQFSSWA